MVDCSDAVTIMDLVEMVVLPVLMDLLFPLLLLDKELFGWLLVEIGVLFVRPDMLLAVSSALTVKGAPGSSTNIFSFSLNSSFLRHLCTLLRSETLFASSGEKNAKSIALFTLHCLPAFKALFRPSAAMMVRSHGGTATPEGNDPIANVDVVAADELPKFFSELLLLALPYPPLALSAIAAVRVVDRVSIGTIRVAPNDLSGLDDAGGLAGGGCIEFSELEEEFILLAGSCSWFL